MLDVMSRPWERVCPAACTSSMLVTFADGICGASHVHSAVDSPYLSGDVGGGVGGKEMHDARDLLRPAQSPHRDLPLDLLDDFLWYGLDHLGRDEAGGNGVHRHGQPVFSELSRTFQHESNFLGEGLGEPEQA